MANSIENYVIDVAKKLRIEKGMTQSDLAFALGVSYGFIGKVESSNFDTKYNLKHINKLALIFGVSPREFLPKEGIKDGQENSV